MRMLLEMHGDVLIAEALSTVTDASSRSPVNGNIYVMQNDEHLVAMQEHAYDSEAVLLTNAACPISGSPGWGANGSCQSTPMDGRGTRGGIAV